MTEGEVDDPRAVDPVSQVTARPSWGWVLELAAVVAAAIAAIASACSASLASRSYESFIAHDRISKEPRVGFSFSKRGGGAGWTLVNSGLGPAEIRWFAATVDGEQVSSWTELLNRLDLPRESIEWSTPSSGVVLPATSEPSTLLWLSKPGLAEKLGASRRRVAFALCYCSLYQELYPQDCWLFAGHSRVHEPNPNCEAEQPEATWSDGILDEVYGTGEDQS